MTLQSSIISIEQLRLYARHGVMEQERCVGAYYRVSVRVHYNIWQAMQTDDVADTLNYAELCQVVTAEMQQPSNLLEHVAGRICKAVFARFPQTTAVELKLTKENPPMGADCAGASVEVVMRNEK
jgi:dihydroneopterin aldolase